MVFSGSLVSPKVRDKDEDRMNKTIAILLQVINGLMNILDEQNLLIQRMVNCIREEAAEDESN